MLSIDQRRDVLAARRQFFDGRPVALDAVPAPILDSWRRCSALGFDSHLAPRLEPMTLGEMRQAIERHDMLRRLCRPEIEALHAEAQSTDCIVILTDAEGLILDTVGNAGFADRAAQVALRPGVPWAEASTGTNAIGAALIEGRPIRVHGIEHFFEPHGFLSCSAAPILDPFGRIAGALDMSGPALADQDHALGLVRLAVDQIEHRFFDGGTAFEKFERCEILRFHRDPGLVGTTQEGILAFEDGRLIAGNRRGLDLLDLDRDAFGRHLFADLFDIARGDRQSSGAATRQRLRGQSGEAFFAQRQMPQPRLQVQLPPRLQRVVPPREIEPIFDAASAAELDRAVRLIEADIPLFLRGETGSGKEVFARSIHRNSARAGRPFIAVNCAALPEGLIESELFGYEEGAFSGARRRGARGLIREAASGILFLDEIGDMPLALQSRLLRVLQEREVRPLGGGAATPVDFWLICASHRDLQRMVTAGQFRADLYFRIAQYTLSLPPLRELVERRAVIARIWRDLSAGSDVALSAAALDLLVQYRWPGNFRQLVSTLRAVLALAEPQRAITPDLLPRELQPGTDGHQDAAAGLAAANLAAANLVDGRPADADGRQMPAFAVAPAAEDLRLNRRATVERVLAACDGNVSRAARRLGIHRSTIYRLLSAG
ncbi:MAG TPA: sigma-54-dependent Fis family transcriptional regulator [Dongiaceae bacterium]|nr:sigma-54-dependent Fis family transcriptional regulator [Dongiaceae bacterium]